MGRYSEESTGVRELVEGDDYWIMRVKKGQMAPKGWITRARLKRDLTPEFIKMHLDRYNAGKRLFGVVGEAARVFNRQQYLLIPGPKPDAKWGPLCP